MATVNQNYNTFFMKWLQTSFDIKTNILNRVKEVSEVEKPDVVLVHGDTSTIFVIAPACF